MLEKYTDVRPFRILFAGGGTGGHLFPAIAIAERIRAVEPTAEITFVGTSDKIESRVVPALGYSFRTIWISGLHRGLKLRNLLFPLKVAVSMIQARSILKSVEPDVVVGTGGYVSGPVLRAAVHCGIATVIQEQNSYPGVTTRLLAKKVDEVHVTFEASKKHLAGVRSIFLSGNPTRDSLAVAGRNEALAYFGFDIASPRKTVLILGGSLGAHSVNEAIGSIAGRIPALNIRLIWQTGTADLPVAKKMTESLRAHDIWIGAFIDNMAYAYAASDLVISRAGATTIAELTRLGKPSILIPYPHAAANHQFENARALVDGGAAHMIEDNDAARKLEALLRSVLNDASLKNMGEGAKKLGNPDAANAIATNVLALAARARGRRSVNISGKGTI